MSDAWNRAEHYRDVATEYRHLATASSSSQMRERYLRMAMHYGKLAEEPDEQARKNAFDQSDLTDDVSRSAASTGPP